MDFSDDEDEEEDPSDSNPFVQKTSNKKSAARLQEEDLISDDYIHGFRHEFKHSERAKTNYDVNEYEEPFIEHGIPNLE